MTITRIGGIDEQFFHDHPDRYARIRRPELQGFKDKQRAVRYLDEAELQFRSLGPHNKDRRRIIVYRLRPEHPSYNPSKHRIFQIPILLFGDETIEDRDDVLLPEIHRIMLEAANK